MAKKKILMLAGDFAFQKNQVKEAVEDWEKMRQHSEDHFPLVFSRLVKGYDALGDAAGAQAVIDYALNRFPTSEVVEQAMKRAFKDKGQQAAAEIVSKGLSGHPTLGTLSVAMEFRKMIAPDDEQLQGLSEMLKKESDRQGRYQCRHCGFLSHSYLWQCPGCGGWDTYPTLRVQDQSLRRDK